MAKGFKRNKLNYLYRKRKDMIDNTGDWGDFTSQEDLTPAFLAAAPHPTTTGSRVGQMVLQSYGQGTPTVTYAATGEDTRYTSDYEGVFRPFYGSKNEPVWSQGRVVENLARYSEDLSNGVWNTAGSGASVSGTNSLVFSSAAYGGINQDNVITGASNLVGHDFIFSMIADFNGYVGTVRLIFDLTGTADVLANVELDGTELDGHRISFNTGAIASGATALRIEVRAYEASVTGQWDNIKFQLEDATGRTDTVTPSEYVATTTASAKKVFNTENKYAVRSNVVYDDGEYVTNGGFDADSDWTKGDAAITISSGVATWSGAQSGNASLTQTLAHSAGDTYVATFAVTRTAGTLDVFLGGDQDTSITSSGTYTHYITTTNSNDLNFRGSSSFIGTVDNVSVKRINSGGRIDTELVSNGGTYNGDGTYTFEGTGDYYARFNGVSDDLITTPDSVASSITGDIDLRIKMSMDDWTPSTTQSPFGKWNGAGDSSYLLTIIATTGIVRAVVSTDGTLAPTADSTVAPTVTNGDTLWIRYTVDVSASTATFYTSSDGVTWDQLGDADVAFSASISAGIYDSGTAVELGRAYGSTNIFTGNIYEAYVYNGIDGTLAVSFNAADNPTNAATHVNPNTYGDRFARFEGTAGDWIRTPDSATNSFSNDIDVQVKVSVDTWGSGIQDFAEKAGSWIFRKENSGALRIWIYDNTSAIAAVSSIVTPFVSSPGIGWVRFTADLTAGIVKFYTSTDGKTWTQLGTDQTTTATQIDDTANPIQIGGRAGGPITGNIYEFKLYNGIGAGQELIHHFNANDHIAGDGTHISQTTGETWTWTDIDSEIYGGETWTWTDIASGRDESGSWTGNDAAAVAHNVDGELWLENSDATGAYLYQTITTIPGRKYRIKWASTSGSGRATVGTSLGGTQLYDPGSSSAGDYQGTFIALGTTTYLSLYMSVGTQGAYTAFEYIQVAQESPYLSYSPAATNLITDSRDLTGWTRSGSPVGGSEEVTNGGFDADSDWTKGTGWSIAAGVASCDGTQTGSSDLTQTGIVSGNSQTYAITYTISNYSAGSVQALVGANGDTTRSSNGTFTGYVDCGAGTNVRMRADVDFVGDIDDVSVKLAPQYDQVGITGEPNTATYLEDDDGAAREHVLMDVAMTGDSVQVTRVWIKKDADTSRFPAVQSYLSGGTVKDAYAWLNTSTGATATSGADAANLSVSSYQQGDWWVLTVEHTDTGTNTTNRTLVYPANGSVIGTNANAATGSCIVGQVEVYDDTTLEEIQYRPPIFTSGGSASHDRTSYRFDLANHSNTQGLWFLEWVPLYATAASGVDEGIITTDAADESHLIYDNANAAAGTLRINDGTGDAGDAWLWSETDNLTIAGAFGGSSMILGVNGAYRSGGVAAYDGAFDTTTAIVLAAGADFPSGFRNIQFYNLPYAAAVTKGTELME